MIRVFIVEDEAFLRKSIKSTIESVNPEFCVIGMAGDGEQALAQIGQLRPDVVFLDVRMPIMDGLECLFHIRKQYPHIICIMLSGYSDFEYVQHALQNQAYDYILKPIDKNKLANLLRNISSKFSVNKNKLQTEHLQSLLSHTVCSPFHSEKEKETFFQETPTFFCIYICEGPYSVNPYSRLDIENFIWTKDRLSSATLPLLSQKETLWILSGDNPKEHFLVIGCSTQNVQLSSVLISSLYNKFIRTSQPVTCLYNKSLVSLDNLQSLFIDIKYASYSKNRFSFSSLSEYQEICSITIAEMGLTSQRLHQFSLYASKQQTQSFCQCAFTILDYCEKNHCPQSLLIHILKKICETANQGALNIAYEEQIHMFFSTVSNYEDLKISLETLLCEILHPTNPEGTEAIISSIHEYIKNHFSENLSLKKLADPHYISIPYMCSLYKKTYGISPIDDIIEQRIDAAKHLLLSQPGFTIKQVSELVGYSDSYYFSRLFKANTGVAPSAFRKETL